MGGSTVYVLLTCNIKGDEVINKELKINIFTGAYRAE